jgi:hypothetical protein
METKLQAVKLYLLFFKQTYSDIRHTGILDLYQGTTKLIDEIPVETLLVKRNTKFFRFTFL